MGSTTIFHTLGSAGDTDQVLHIRKSVSCTHMLLAFTSCGTGFAPNLNATPPPVIPLVIPPRSIPTGSVIASMAWASDGGNVTTGDDGGYVRT